MLHEKNMLDAAAIDNLAVLCSGWRPSLALTLNSKVVLASVYPLISSVHRTSVEDLAICGKMHGCAWNILPGHLYFLWHASVTQDHGNSKVWVDRCFHYCGYLQAQAGRECRDFLSLRQSSACHSNVRVISAVPVSAFAPTYRRGFHATRHSTSAPICLFAVYFLLPSLGHQQCELRSQAELENTCRVLQVLLPCSSIVLSALPLIFNDCGTMSRDPT